MKNQRQASIFGQTVDFLTQNSRVAQQQLQIVNASWPDPVPWACNVGQIVPVRQAGPFTQVDLDFRDLQPDHENAYAVVEWGTDGAAWSAEVDVAVGQCFTVHGTNVKITGVVPGDWNNVLPEPVTLPYQMTASVVPCSTVARVNARRTRIGTNVVAGASINFPIPRWAKDVMVRYRSTSALTYVVEWYNDPNELTLLEDEIVTNIADWRGVWHDNWHPVPPDATIMTIRNTAAVTMNNPRAIFDLAFG